MGAILRLVEAATGFHSQLASSVISILHLLSYSTLFGMTVYQTFVMTSVSFKALPTSAFTTLQKRVFPTYFSLQSTLTLATLLTYPFPPAEILRSWDGWLLLGTEAMALLNWQWYGPLTSRIMSLRIHQEHKDGRSHNEEEKSPEMKKLNRKFSAAHAMSIHLNLISVLTMFGYCLKLASRVKLD